MNRPPIRLRQVVDWGAAIWAGLIAGTIFLLLNVFLIPAVVGGDGWVIIHYLASLILGEQVLQPPFGFDLLALVVALAVNYVLALIFSVILALIIHRWGLLTGIILGALFGLAIYGINFYTMTLLFPWFFAINHWLFAVTHVVFGALAGGIYESFEVEEFVPVEPAE